MYLVQFLDGGLLQLAWWQVILATLALTHVTIASVTIFLHRSQAHRGLDLHPIASHFFRAWLWLTTGMQTRDWVAIHRKHHAKCETPEDPHSPQTRGLKTVLWTGAELYMAEAKNNETLQRYGHGTPNDWLEHHVYSRFTWHGVALMLGIDLILFGIGGLAVWAIQMIWIPFFAAGVINGIGHFWGYRNFECVDASTNISPWGILIGGEELHNNHHTHPTSAKLSSKWYEFDLGWTYIRILQAVGLAKVLRVAPVPRVVEPARRVDLDTLQAVIANRYDLLARYTRELKKAYRDELARLRLPQADAARFGKLWGLLKRADVQGASAGQKQTLSELLAVSGVMRTLVEMREELAATWLRSSASREQMLVHLQDWIVRAEASGISALQAAALRIRSYAPTAS
ncbi:MAG TPA: fatty acid desaturase [Burkholderiaceae bacterium]|nr:fatty acid desaturase [Burkholderiaceae bacterium]